MAVKKHHLTQQPLDERRSVQIMTFEGHKEGMRNKTLFEPKVGNRWASAVLRKTSNQFSIAVNVKQPPTKTDEQE